MRRPMPAAADCVSVILVTLLLPAPLTAHFPSCGTTCWFLPTRPCLSAAPAGRSLLLDRLADPPVTVSDEARNVNEAHVSHVIMPAHASIWPIYCLTNAQIEPLLCPRRPSVTHRPALYPAGPNHSSGAGARRPNPRRGGEDDRRNEDDGHKHRKWPPADSGSHAVCNRRGPNRHPRTTPSQNLRAPGESVQSSFGPSPA